MDIHTQKERKKEKNRNTRERRDEDVGSDALMQPLEGREIERWSGGGGR